jgi:steroid 5-alpha reductase family enzyme
MEMSSTLPDRQAWIRLPVILAIGGAVAWAGSQGSARVGAVPVFALCGVLAFAINWVVFVHAYIAQTERFFDLTGSVTYVSVVGTALALSNATQPRALLLGTLVLVWAVRLGSFLFGRIEREGGDERFDELKPSFPRFLAAWTLQGLWVFLTLACALAAITSLRTVPVGGVALVGAMTWAVGFSIEVVADRQKRRFREDPDNAGRFIQDGLWAWSRHPNYFGEIVLWFGVAILALPELSGWQYITLVSPVFVYRFGVSEPARHKRFSWDKTAHLTRNATSATPACNGPVGTEAAESGRSRKPYCYAPAPSQACVQPPCTASP